MWVFLCRDKENYDDYDASNFVYLYYLWAASVLGPVLFLLAILHAALWKWPSSVVGSMVSSVYMCVGHYTTFALLTAHLNLHIY